MPSSRSIFTLSKWRRFLAAHAGRKYPKYARSLWGANYVADGVISQADLSLVIGDQPGRNSYRHYIAEQLAWHTSSLDGAFVSLGVANGQVASRILQTVKPQNTYWLIDAWDGRRSATETSVKSGYTEDFTAIAHNFSTYPNVRLLRGIVPTILCDFHEPKIAFAHFNLGDPESEVAALGLLAPKIQPGGAILIDAFGRSISNDDNRRDYLRAAEQNKMTTIAMFNGQLLLLARSS